MLKPIDYKGKWVLITGASSGLGYEFAVQFAQKGANILLTARSLETLTELKATLEGKYGVTARVIPIDLSKEEAPHRIIEYIKEFNLDVDILVNNAGLGLTDTFYHQQQDDLHRMNMVNMVAVADLSSIFVQGMIRRGGIGILNVSSVVAFSPIPYSANYAATKSYVLSLSAAMHQELLKKGVRVSCLCPGPIKTNFFNAAGISNPIGKFATTESVVRQAIVGFEKNRVIILPKEHRFTLLRLSSFVPTKTRLRLIERKFGKKH